MALLERVLKRLFKYKEITGKVATDVYLRRFILLNHPWGRIVLHQILRSDEDRDLHCHPFSFISLILSKGYTEETFLYPKNCEYFHVNQRKRIKYTPGNFLVRKAEDSHRLILDKPAWTLVFMGRKYRKWGFHTESGWQYWRDYLGDYSSPES